jgi:ribosomal protein L32
MGLPGHRRTSSHKRRRASHFALSKPALTTNSKTGAVHLSHRAAPGATEYNGHAIHVKGRDKKLEKLLGAKKKSEKTADEHHDHEGHTHA